ncbi:hypothetical protein E1161_01575 [Saccharopolyspora aridisoli]|uniref:DUF5753 domain-containing protein n=1 Tax=Saccharopolyspora aridisoli TaxID=2530385 RepID=A0A4R4UVP4_9PSEU|nr:hypothetical protein E1161_01575 [Saccharopolyspora aridisoli]
MAEQLRYMMKAAERPNVAVQVLPLGATEWHPAHAGIVLAVRVRRPGSDRSPGALPDGLIESELL